MLFGWFKKDKNGQRRGHNFTEEERELSTVKKLEADIRRARIRKLQEKLQRIKDEQEIEDLEEQVERVEGDFYGEEDDEEEEGEFPSAIASPDALFGEIVMRVLSASNAQKDVPAAASRQKKTLTDDELRAMLAEIPAAYRKKAKKMTNEELISLAQQLKPEIFEEYDDETIKRALLIVKE